MYENIIQSVSFKVLFNVLYMWLDWDLGAVKRQAVGQEQGPLSLVSTNEELLGRNSSGSGLENREYGRRDPLRWPRDTLYPWNLPLASPTSGGHSIGMVHSRTKAKELVWTYSMPTRCLPCRSCEEGRYFPPWHPQQQPGERHEGNSDHSSWPAVSTVGYSALMLRDVLGNQHGKEK
jgi:hypothetical protein